MLGYEDPATLPLHEVHERIITFNKQLAYFWRDASGWAPARASEILDAARLDWQVELSRTLRLWTQTAPVGEAQSRLILGWANLGALVEGSLKLLLCVHVEDYWESSSALKRKGRIEAPDGLMMEHLRQFVIAEWLVPKWHEWIHRVQQRRNAVHAFRHRDLGSHDEFKIDVTQYLAFLREINAYLPYPGGGSKRDRSIAAS